MSLSLYEKLPEGLREFQAKFVALAEAFGHRHKLPATPGPASGSPFEFDAVAMSLRFDPFRMPFHLVAVVDFGPLPERDAAAVRELLEANFRDANVGAVYSVAPETGHVVCFAPIALADLDLDGLDATLGALASAARRGRA